MEYIDMYLIVQNNDALNQKIDDGIPLIRQF